MDLENQDFLYKKAPLSSQETVLGKWCASRIMGGISVNGGQMVLTNSRIILHPFNMDIPLMIGQGFDAITRVPMFKVLGAAYKITEKIVSIPLDQIERVEPIGKQSLLDFSAKVAITLRDNSRHLFAFADGNLKSRYTTILPQTMMRKNAQVRDDFVQRLQAMLPSDKK